MSILSLITKKELEYNKMFDELRGSGLSTIFYGTSAAASKFYKSFIELELNIDTVMVSPAYFVENSYFFDHKIANSNDILDTTAEPTSDKKNVVVFFGIDDESLKMLKASKLIEKIFLIDGGVCFLTNFLYDEIKEKDTEYTETYNLLQDKLSKDIMVGFINTRISGFADSIREYSIPDSYFPRGVVSLQDHEVFLDCGAFDGDTIEIFKQQMKSVNKSYDKIFGFEPDKENFKKLQINCAEDDKIFPLNIGVFNKRDTLNFTSEGTGGSRLNETGTSSIEVDMIDNLIGEDVPVTFIKMDLEGVELEALKGAKDTIINCKPILAIAVYHKIEDLIEIPKYIKSLVSDYKFYLRAQCYDSVDMTLFAIAR